MRLSLFIRENIQNCQNIKKEGLLWRGFDPEGLMKVIEAEKVTWLFILPMIYRYLLDHPKVSDSTCPALISACTP